MLSTAVILSLGLVGCGNNDSSETNSKNTSVSGKAIDGYLESALVCLDRNNNNNCDSDEPMSITKKDGSYTLTGVTDEDKQKYAILVKAILGQTKDSDDNGTTVTNAFFLKTPASKPDVVSPLTTMVQNKLESDPTLDVDTAIATVKKSLGVADDINITADYMALKKVDNNNSATYEKLHQVSQVIADTIGESLKKSNISLDDSDAVDASTVILDNLNNNLKTISKQAEDNNFSVSSSVSNMTLEVNATVIEKAKEVKAEAKKIAEAKKTVTDSKDLEAEMKNGGLYTYDFYNWNNTPEIDLDKIAVDSNNEFTYTWQQYSYDVNSSSLVENNQTYPTSFYKSINTKYIPTDDGWKAEDFTWDNDKYTSKVTFNSDGSMNEENQWGKSITTVLSVLNLEGLNINSILDNNKNWWEDSEDDNNSITNFISSEKVFSPDAVMVKAKTEWIEKNNGLNVSGEYCYSDDASKVDKEDMTCSDYGTHFYDVNDSNYDDNLTFASLNDFKNYFAKGSEHYFWADQYKAQVDDNTIYFYDDNNTQKALTGVLKLQTYKKANFYEIIIPKEYTWNYQENTQQSSTDEKTHSTDDDYSQILVEVDGHLRQGYWDKSNYWEIIEYYNKAAIDDIRLSIDEWLQKL